MYFLETLSYDMRTISEHTHL